VGLTADLGRGRAGIDTSVFVYFMEEDPRFLPLRPLTRCSSLLHSPQVVRRS